MKAVKIRILGVERYMAYTGEAMFTIIEKYGSCQAMLEQVRDTGRAGFEATCETAALLLEQGELARRSMGYDAAGILKTEQIKAALQPSDIPELKVAIFHAIELGYGRDVQDENKEIDLGLAELEEKKTR